MTTNKFNRNIPESYLEELELHNMGGIEYIQMLTEEGEEVEVPSYNVVSKLFDGYALPGEHVREIHRQDFEHMDTNEIPF